MIGETINKNFYGERCKQQFEAATVDRRKIRYRNQYLQHVFHTVDLEFISRL